MSQGRTVRLFLVDGSPTGILTAEIMNWTGHILVAPRSSLADALKRPEASRTGVYFLTGEDMDQPHLPRVYVGEGDSVVDRIKSHAKDSTKDFWTHACIVTSKDANLTKAHVRYLENRLVEILKASGRAVIANGNEPASKQLPESDIADMEFFLGQLRTALPVVGFDFLRPKIVSSTVPSTSSVPDEQAKTISLVLDSKKNGVFAKAVESDGEITVLQGATATLKDFVSNNYATRRKELIEAGQLLPTVGGSTLTLETDVTFRSPSEAAAVLLNRNSNGRIEWKLEATGQTLKDWQDTQLEAVNGQ
jgi:hypothetical protein